MPNFLVRFTHVLPEANNKTTTESECGKTAGTTKYGICLQQERCTITKQHQSISIIEMAPKLSCSNIAVYIKKTLAAKENESFPVRSNNHKDALHLGFQRIFKPEAHAQ